MTFNSVDIVCWH